MTIVFDTLSQVSGGLPGTAPKFFTAVTTSSLEDLLTAGAVSDYVDGGELKTRDVLLITYSDGTEDVAVSQFEVTATSGGSVIQFNGEGFLIAANNLSDVDSASTSRTNLGLEIGTDVQAYDAGLQSIAGLTTSADKMIYTTALDTYAVASLSAFARTVLDDADASTARATLGLTIGTNVQAYDAGLQSISALTTAANKMIYTTALDTYAVTDLTAMSRTFLAGPLGRDSRGAIGIYAGIGIIQAGGGATRDVTDANIAVNDTVVATQYSYSAEHQIIKTVAGAGKFTITYTADPGDGSQVNYIVIKDN